MQTIFCSILIFNYIANELSPNLKFIMYIKQKTSSNIIILERVKPHNYNKDSNEKNIKIPPLSPFSSRICLLASVQSAHDTNNVFCKIFMALSAY